ncbi:TPP2 [Cordylochernes scorpioides]|uniref:tripeptidyl-peptidase II n=1 Tax=Cordylochernes scorpioides TaxID=51811 RepID=A0ABY6LKU4_9ARAC|nr:TPP2 [Cordylochernes scorpioides]
MMDASGAGDVDTSTVVEEVDGEIVGLTGRTLKKERKEKRWNSSHRVLVAEVTRKLQEFDNLHPNQQHWSLEERLEHEELEARLEVLNNLDKKYLDVGPVWDCVVFHDGEMWRAILDTSEIGDLEKGTLLGPYSQTLQYATLTEQDMLSYSVNIHDEGNLLEIVGMSTAHGTHVASIAAAYFPDEPDRNGIAPGAQIVSIGIGDIRLGSMETGTSLIIKVMELKCDIINLSYGEHAHWSEGRIMNLVHEVVNNHGVIMVCSAGNHGPALSTVGTPPYMFSSSVIGVAAYCSTEMMKANYCLRELLPGTNYSWSSRGPSLDGDIGVSLCAPGGAITSVPRWTLRGSQLMNGTSMSSPHVAGAIALLLSGMKDKGLPYSPYSVRRAIENTALKVENYDVFSMGHGLLQVDKAFDHLLEYHTCAARDVRFSLSCGDHGRGIYYREAYRTQCTSLLNVVVEPVFLNEAHIDPQRKIDFHLNLKLVVDKPWVSVGSHLNLYYASRFFNIKVDPLGLSPGLHYTAGIRNNNNMTERDVQIKAYDVNAPEKGPLFQFPITVVVPKKPENTVCPKLIYKDLFVKSGQLYREFIDVPSGATWARWLLQSDTVLELCIGKWWSSIGSTEVNVSVVFHGLMPHQNCITMMLTQYHQHAAEGIQRVDLSCKLNYEETAPSVSLKYHVMVLKPVESKIQPLGKRDIVPTGHQIYELVLTYNFSLTKTTDVTPICALLSDLLYESEFESQLWMLFDTNKRLVACGDAYPSKVSPHSCAKKLEKGEYILKLQIRQEQRNLLEKLTDLPMLIHQKLPASLSLDLYATHASALVGGKKFTSKCLLLGSTCPLFIHPLPADKVPKGALPGHFLQGTISFAKDDAAKKVNVYPFRYIFAETGTAGKKVLKSTAMEKDKSPEEEFTEALRDLKISWIYK